MQALKEKEINFIDAMNRKERKNTDRNIKQILLLAFPVFLFVIVAGAILFLYTSTSTLEQKIENIQKALISEEIIQKQADLALLQNEISGLQGFQNNYNLLENMFESQVETDKKTIHTIISQCYGKIVITDMSMENSNLNLNCQCTEYKEAALYVQRLEKTELFSKVNYQGFEKDGGKYIFSLVCVLKNK